ncbi:3',5'-cyclic adenosine monophosphate phosphodiesterase CpdA [uncultured archaeon]|nr:3',5'-cyclic adenosine monophosphate phosphodiesterase CpdA [uncultured archaeon]
MKILALGDPHGKLPKNLDSLIKKNKVETIICTGDFAFTPDKPWLKESWKGISDSFVIKSYKKVVDELCSYGIPLLTLRGNMFLNKKKIADKILRKHKNLINRYTAKYKLNHEEFIFFDLSYELSTLMKDQKQDIFFKSRLKKNNGREKRLNELLKENSNSILITHNPPYGVVDKAWNGEHVGSKILLNAIKKYQPKYVFCGHIHEAKGRAKIGETIIYNLGCRGDYIILDTDKNKIVTSNF